MIDPADLPNPSTEDAVTRRLATDELAALAADARTIATAAPAQVSVNLERTGDFIGRYRLITELGEGGFGVVWRAEQSEPIHREVALKVIKPGMDSREIIARFEAERQTLALMDHPNIAGVLDAGTTDNGRPFFVMELVKGVPITDYCDAHQLTIRQRLELFIPVCQAVQHAHQKAILHRDLKPSNILVTEVDGKPVPKVIDFGIAKALGTSPEAALQVSLLQTQAGMVIGTPQYMSPEQAGAAPDLDTRSDIYTLGVILFELLTGDTPLSRDSLRKAALDEVLRVVRESEPSRPSSRVSSATEASTQTCATRHTAPAKLRRSLRGDLDWITLKALEKERERRYESAAALAQDLERHLRDEPVEAGPPSMGYRLRKLVRKNKGLVAATAAIAVTLIVGIVATGLALRRSDAMLTKMQLQRAEQLFDEDDAPGGLAYLAAVLRRHPDDRVTASHLLSALRDRSYARPLLPPLHHDSTVYGVVWSPDGKRVASVTRDHLSLWNAETGEPLCPPVASSAGAEWRNVRFSEDGGKVLAIGTDSQVFDGKSGRALTPPLLHENRWTDSTGNRDAVFSPDGRRVFTISNLLLLRAWDAENGRLLAELKLEQPPWALAAHPDGRRVAISTSQGVHLWNSDTQKIEKTWPGGVQQLLMSLDGRRLFARVNSTLRGYDLTTMELLPWSITTNPAMASFGQAGERMQNAQDTIKTFDLSSDGRMLVLLTNRGMVEFYDAEAGIQFGDAWPVKRPLESVAFSHDGMRLLALGERFVRVREMASGGDVCSAVWLGSKIVCGSLSRDGERLAIGTASGEVRLLRVAATEAHPMLFGRAVIHPPMVVNEDQTQLAAPTGAGAQVWDLATGSRIGRVEHGEAAWSLALNSKLPLMATGGTSQRLLKLWDTRTGKPARPNIYTPIWLGSLRFSADGTRVYTNTGSAYIYDVATGQLTTKPMGENISNSFLTRDGGRMLVVEAKKYGVKIFDPSTGELAVPEIPYAAAIGGYAFGLNADETMFAAGSDDGRVRVWRVLDGTAVTPWMQHAAQVSSVCFSPDGKLLVTGSRDQTVRLWSLPSGALVGEPILHARPVVAALFSPDGKRIAVASDDGVVRLWDTLSRRALTDRLPVRSQAVPFFHWLRDGTRLIGGVGLAHLWDVPAIELAPPAWLADWAEAVAEQRLDTSGRLESLPPDACFASLTAFKEIPGDDVFARTARWFFREPGDRPISPDSRFTMNEYVRMLANYDSARAPRAAIHAAPMDARGWARAVELEPVLGSNIQYQLQRFLAHAERLNANEPLVARSRTRFEQMLGHRDSALQAARRAIELDPHDSQARQNLAQLLAERREYSSAADELTSAIAYVDAGGYDEGMKQYQRGLRRDFLLLAGRVDECAPENLDLHQIQPRAPEASERQINLSAYFNLGLGEDARHGPNQDQKFEDMPHGLQTMAGTLFDIRGMVQLRHKDLRPSLPSAVRSIRVGQTCNKIHFLHSLLRSPPKAADPVITYQVTYDDGSVESIPVQNNREVGHVYRSDGKPPPAPLVTAWMGQTAYTRQFSQKDGKTITACIYKMSWRNPHPEKTVKSIDFVSGTPDAAPVLFAITLE